MRWFKIIALILGVIVLTVLTQIGGVVLLLSAISSPSVTKKISNAVIRSATKILLFVALYLIATFAIVPWTAPLVGRVPLPMLLAKNLQPAKMATVLLNRNYVNPSLRDAAFNVAEHMNKKYPGTTINYLDANFPFINKFPLFPHRSHNDGKKLDVSFQYNDSNTDLMTSNVPSWIGYGICEEPRKGEDNVPVFCEQKGYWQYNLLRKAVSQRNKKYFMFNEERTRELVVAFASENAIGKIFIEPHLKTRLRLTSNKIRFHGCAAVRHDDHIHVQLK
jgi:hypothetical protein